ncbi:hypothetical protein [Phenylobacterium sp.]|uniref:hypothetical protein n=1 Tax=Phenylobacterium sp. TaxID=1871053 RepID=UPI0035AD9BDB|nr:hypothetical protein [Pseudomonadota bacterium]
MANPDTPPLAGDYAECPYCAELILKKAIKCKHCGEFVGSNAAAGAPEPASSAGPRKPPSSPLAFVLAVLGASGIGAYGYVVQSAAGFAAGAALYAAAVAFVLLGPIGWKIGDALRRYAMPEAVFVRGGFWELVQNRLFWQLGPQFIGMASVGAVLVYGAIVLAPPSTTMAVAESKAEIDGEAAVQAEEPASQADEAAGAEATGEAAVEAAVAHARELCRVEGTEDNPVTFDELTEMSGVQVAAFEEASRRGVPLTAADQVCLRDAQAFLRDSNSAGVGDDLEPAPEEAQPHSPDPAQGEQPS